MLKNLKKILKGKLLKKDQINLDLLPLDFIPLNYLQLNPDVALSSINPVVHYILHGISEGRIYKYSINADLNSKEHNKTIIALIGHPACGKSALLEQFKCNRSICDMDKVFLEVGIKPDVFDVMRWFENIKSNVDIISISNITEILENLYLYKYFFNKKIHFLYIKRPLSKIDKYMKIINSDNMKHAKPDDISKFYEFYDEKYTRLADSVIFYDGSDIGYLANLVNLNFNKVQLNN